MFSVKKCAHCGYALPDEVLFCSECGTKFAPNEEQLDTATVEAAVIPAAEPVPEDPAQVAETEEAEIKPEAVPGGVETDVASVEPVAEKPAKRKKIKWWHITIPAVLVVAVVAALLLINGIILYIPQYLPGSNKASGAMNRVDALLVGLGGAAATLPGVSCIGTAVSIASIRGMDTKKALSLALLMNIPVNLGFAFFE